MLCCRKRPPSPNEKLKTPSRETTPQANSSVNGKGPRKSKSPSPPALARDPLTKGRPASAANSPVSPESIVLAETSPQTSAAPPRTSPDKSAANPAGSPDPSTAFAIQEYLQRISNTTDLDTLLAEGKSLISEGKKRLKEGGLDAKMSADLSNLIARLEAVTGRLESVANKSSGEASEGEVAASVVAYNDLFNGPLADVVKISDKIGGEVKTQMDMVQAAFREQHAFVVNASKCKEPDQNSLQKLLAPTSQNIAAIQEFREKNRGNKYFNHLSVISESIPALGWVAMAPTPAPFVKEMSDAGQFFSNRVLKDYKEKDKTHVEWSRAWTKMLAELQAYVKLHHTTGLTWNKKGVDVSTVSPAPTAGGAGGPPPPPPPPPPGLFDDVSSTAPSAGANADDKRNALFADLNKGTAITKGLRRVTDDMKTHKNPGLKKVSDDQKTHKNTALRLQSPVPYKAAAQPVPKPAAKTSIPDKPPRFELDGKKWMVEYQKGNKNIMIDDTNMKQQVYVYRCQDSTVQVKGKVNSIVLDNCKKCAVVFESLVSALEVVNSQSIQAQVMGKVPTISIDKTDGCQVYLSKDSLDTEIVSAKSSEMNVLVPDQTGEYKEHALPEQFKTTWGGSAFTTQPSDIAC